MENSVLLQLKWMQMTSPIHLICSNLSPFHFALTQKPGDKIGNSNGEMDKIWPLKCLPFQHGACKCYKIEIGKVLELLPVSIHLNGSNLDICFMVSCRGSIHYLSNSFSSSCLSLPLHLRDYMIFLLRQCSRTTRKCKQN